jgi:radical S-adenosyl methionine domain-containing protein 2
MKCRFCFSHYRDIDPLTANQSIELTKTLSRTFEKINFVGGEPTISPILHDLVRIASSNNRIISITSNGTGCNDILLRTMPFHWLNLSIDSQNPKTHHRMGRTTQTGPLSNTDYIHIADQVHKNNKDLKINTVVCRENVHENMSELILNLRPKIWKIFQVLKIHGENETALSDVAISQIDFQNYVERHRQAIGNTIEIVAEDNSIMTGSYAMIDPAGRFFDNVDGHHSFSQPILEVGIEQAWKNVRFHPEKFFDRGGNRYFELSRMESDLLKNIGGRKIIPTMSLPSI